MTLQTLRAIYSQGKLSFPNPEQAPQDGAEVMVTFVAPSAGERAEAIRALRGRAKGEHLVRRLLEARKMDREGERRG